MPSTTLNDQDSEKLQNAIALTIELGEALKRAIFYTQEMETLNHIQEIVAITIKLRSLLISWQSGDTNDDYQQFRQPDLTDKIDHLLDLSDMLWKELTELKAEIVTTKKRCQ
jgi:hypothetical protein